MNRAEFMACALRASGRYFEVDEFLKTSSFDVMTAFRRGELRSASTSVTRISESSGLEVNVSGREPSDLSGQIEDAQKFLIQNIQEIRRLCDFPGLERMDLDFCIEERDVVFQSDSFPHALLSLMGKLSIGLVVSRHSTAPALRREMFTEQ